MIVVHDQHRNGRAVHDILSDTAENHPAQHAAIRPGDDDQFGVGCFSALRISYSVHQRFLLSRRISPACVGLLAPLGCESRRGDFADAALGVGWNHDVENQNSDPSRTRIPHRKIERFAAFRSKIHRDLYGALRRDCLFRFRDFC